MSQGTKIVAVVLFVLFLGTGVYYVTLSPAKPATPPAAKATEPATPKPPPARDPGSITMNPATGAGPSAPRIADPLAAGVSPAAASPTAPAAAPAAAGVANPPRVALGTGGAPVSVMPPLTVTRPAAPTATVSGATAPGVPEVRPTAPAPAVTPAPVVASRPTAATSATAGPREHVVASGETLSSIAARYLGSGSRWAEIAKANPGVNPNSMRVGTKLNIPAASAPVAESRAASTPSAASANEYVVKAGDTLTGIARQTLGSADWESIYEANRSVIGSNPAALRVGMRLAIPKRS